MLQGRTALIRAAAIGDVVMVEKLLLASADICLALSKASHLKLLQRYMCFGRPHHYRALGFA